MDIITIHMFEKMSTLPAPHQQFSMRFHMAPGDLIHIKRDPTTGQPILQKRWVEYPQDSFGEAFENGFNPACAEPETLNNRDFVRAASLLAGAANKTGIVTVDLVQYMNRILKITQTTI